MKIQITRTLVIPVVLWAILSAILLGVMLHFDASKESFAGEDRSLRNVQAGIQEVTSHVTSGISTRLDAAAIAAAKSALEVDVRLTGLGASGASLRKQFEEYYAAMVAVNSIFLENRIAEGEKRLSQLKSDGAKMSQTIQTRITDVNAAREQSATLGRTLHIVLLLAIAAAILRIILVVFVPSKK